jgi:hypothetical protein
VIFLTKQRSCHGGADEWLTRRIVKPKISGIFAIVGSGNMVSQRHAIADRDAGEIPSQMIRRNAK